MAQKWYQKATVQVALVTGILSLLGMIIGAMLTGKAPQVPEVIWRVLQPPRACPRMNAEFWSQYEAEDAQLSGDAAADSEHEGFSGRGFVSGYGHGRVGTATTFTVVAPSAGTYRVDLCYANANRSPRHLSLYLNGERVRQTVLPNAAGWSRWSIKTEVLSLRAGPNTISYRKDAGDDAAVNLDFIRIAGE